MSSEYIGKEYQSLGKSFHGVTTLGPLKRQKVFAKRTGEMLEEEDKSL